MAGHSTSILIIIACILLNVIVPCQACGGLVHGEIAQRSKFLFSRHHDPKTATEDRDRYASRIAQWLLRHDGSILAGSYMPDWGYGCSGADDLSEKMHWPPFLKAAVEYIRDTYPDPQSNEKAQALIAFLFAVSGHQVQDAAWHSIGLLMGFIDEVAKVDCHGNFQNAHDVLDWGGDAIFGKRFSGQNGASDWAFGDWYVPVDDLAAIYERLGMHLSTWQMKYCIIRLRGVLLAAVKGASLFYGRYGQQSPFMLDYFDEYYLGGIDDMTSTTVECWTNLVEWFRNGDIGDPWNLCPLTTAITRRTEGAVSCIPDVVRRDLKAEEEEVSRYLHAEDRDGIFRVWYDGPRTFDSTSTKHNQLTSQNVSSESPYARFGHSMAFGEFGLGNPLQIAISSPFETHEGHPPYTGNVHVFRVSNNEIVPTTTLLPTPSTFDIPGMRFGLSLASFKVQSKNISALAVGAPGWDPAGRVFIYTGTATNNLDIMPQLTIMPWHKVWYRSQYGKRAFGSKLFVADVDGDGKDDLLISSPWADFTGAPVLPDPPAHEHPHPPSENTWDSQHGGIAVFTGKQLEMMIGGTNVLDEDCAYFVSPPLGEGFERFGTSIAFAKKAGILLVGEPGSGRNSSISGRGRVYGVKVTKEKRSVVFTIDGPDVDENSLSTEFGGGGLVSGVTSNGTEWFAVSAHNTDYENFRQAGIVQIYTLSEKLNKTSNSTIYITKHAITLRAEEPQIFGKFGAVTESDGRDILWISSGWANEEDGVVWSYDVGKGLAQLHDQLFEIEFGGDIQITFHKPQDEFEVAKVFAQGTEPKARFGDSLLVGDFNADGLIDIAVGSPFSRGNDQSVPLTGKINIFFSNTTV